MPFGDAYLLTDSEKEKFEIMRILNLGQTKWGGPYQSTWKIRKEVSIHKFFAFSKYNLSIVIVDHYIFIFFGSFEVKLVQPYLYLCHLLTSADKINCHPLSLLNSLLS